MEKPEAIKATEKKKRIPTSKFKRMTLDEVTRILGSTICKDDVNKVLTFLTMLSAYTDDSQFNISFNAPSSTGKTYIPNEIAKLFPAEDVRATGYCSPSAFFHEEGKWNKETKTITQDLERKILIFLDQPHGGLLERLRPILSHDKKELMIKITDKTEKAGLKTKTVIVRGYPSVIFCTAGLQTDEQEATRFLFLSPDLDQEKIREAIELRIRKDSDVQVYQTWLDANPERQLLKERIEAIKQADIAHIRIPDTRRVKSLFFSGRRNLKPRHIRDIGRVMSIIKVIALLNLWFRKRKGKNIEANREDIKEAFKIWNSISEPQELNISPYVFEVYRKVLMPLWGENGTTGIPVRDMTNRYFQVFKKEISRGELYKQLIPAMVNAGLISTEQDPADRRKMVIFSPIKDK
jgi:hypothetical protein